MKNTNQNDMYILWLLSAIMFYMSSITQPSQIEYLMIICAVLMLIFSVLRVDTTIIDNQITYTIRILTFKIKTIFIDPSQIRIITLKRNGFLGKKAVIKRFGKLPLIISSKKNAPIMNEIINLANTHQITVLKSRDYLILERRYS